MRPAEERESRKKKKKKEEKDTMNKNVSHGRFAKDERVLFFKCEQWSLAPSRSERWTR
jgi:hypothetical protein